MPATILILSSAPFRTDYPGLFRASIPAPEDGWDVSYALLRNGLMTSEVFPQRNPDVPIAIGFVPASDGGIRHDPNPENQSKRSGLQGQVIHRKRPKTLSTSPWIRFLVCESYEGLVAESRQSFFEDNMPFPQMLSAGIEN
ncbi:MAG: hypothetical protein OXE94_00645 [Aestuariivita sp.]|nr:hypothetical protein [Aestuariivita sp.]MCY4202630.1 hypothetical protein [Aestuariivita sp.]